MLASTVSIFKATDIYIPTCSQWPSNSHHLAVSRKDAVFTCVLMFANVCTQIMHSSEEKERGTTGHYFWYLLLWVHLGTSAECLPSHHVARKKRKEKNQEPHSSMFSHLDTQRAYQLNSDGRDACDASNRIRSRQSILLYLLNRRAPVFDGLALISL